MSPYKIAENLTQLRKAAKKNQQEVASECNITRQALSNYERGKRIPDMEKLLLLADYYNVTLETLLS